MSYPVGTMYGQVQPEDVAEIVEEYLEKENVVGRLALMELSEPTIYPKSSQYTLNVMLLPVSINRVISREIFEIEPAFAIVSGSNQKPST